MGQDLAQPAAAAAGYGIVDDQQPSRLGALGLGRGARAFERGDGPVDGGFLLDRRDGKVIGAKRR
jgi:hypothetical protein